MHGIAHEARLGVPLYREEYRPVLPAAPSVNSDRYYRKVFDSINKKGAAPKFVFFINETRHVLELAFVLVSSVSIS